MLTKSGSAAASEVAQNTAAAAAMSRAAFESRCRGDVVKAGAKRKIPSNSRAAEPPLSPVKAQPPARVQRCLLLRVATEVEHYSPAHRTAARRPSAASPPPAPARRGADPSLAGAA